MPDIFLYSGEATPSDIKLRDPTTVPAPDLKLFTQNFTVLGLGGYSRVLWAGKSALGFKSFVQNFTVLGLGGYPRPPWGSFGGKSASTTTTTKRRPILFIANVGRLMN